MMKTINRGFIVLLIVLCTVFSACNRNPLTKQRTMAFVSNSTLFPLAFQQYEEFLKESIIVTGTPEAEMVQRVGDSIKLAAERLFDAEGEENYLDDYEWEYHLIANDEINAWCMPGGKIVIYTGILPLAVDEDGLAVIMGHEVAHTILNHGQQRMSAGLLQELGRLGVSIGASLLDVSPETQALLLAAYGIGSELGGILPFSRSHENEADYYGLILMTIAEYDPEAAVSFWDRMAVYEGRSFEWLSTHPSGENRAAQLRRWIPEANETAERIQS